MSTNYYLITTPSLPLTVKTVLGEVEVCLDRDDPKIHVGHAYGAGNKRLGFNWCIHPDTIRAACEDNPDTEIIENEYGDRFTGQKFLYEVLSKVTVGQFSIGERFI